MKIAPATATLTTLCHDNLEQLDGIDRLLARIDAGDYTMPQSAADPIGKHVRHVLEHYESLLQGTDGSIDYESRARDPAVEADPGVARERIASIRERLVALAETGAPESIRVRYTPAGGDHAVSDIESTLERECHFVLSHTVHHMALIALLAQRHGRAVPEDFGVAGSTLRYRAASAAAAP
ncbi:MAG: DinB family protein [Halofilum sp. (in: g-proteobacteria)]